MIGGPASIRHALDVICGASAPDLPRPHPASVPAANRRDIVWDRAGTNFLAFHLHAAAQARASEIHFIPRGSSLTVAYRTDAGLEPQTSEQLETSLYLRARPRRARRSDSRHSQSAVWGSTIVSWGRTRIAVSACHRPDRRRPARFSGGSSPEKAQDLTRCGVSPLGVEAEIRDVVEGPRGWCRGGKVRAKRGSLCSPPWPSLPRAGAPDAGAGAGAALPYPKGSIGCPRWDPTKPCRAREPRRCDRRRRGRAGRRAPTAKRSSRCFGGLGGGRRASRAPLARSVSLSRS